MGASYFVTSVTKPDSKLIVGYIQDPQDAPAKTDRIDFKKITHLNVAFANPIDTAGNLSLPTNLVEIVSRAHHYGVKVLISIGGGYVSTTDTEREKYFRLIGQEHRSEFVRRLTEYVDTYHLDGIDVDLEGPAINKDYASFIADLALALKPKGRLLTAALSSWFGGDQVTEEALSHFDWVNVMAYDATGPWAPTRPGPHSSLDFAKTSATHWLGRGVPKSKLVLGVPFYGWGFGDSFNQGGYTFAQIVDKYPGSQSSDQVGRTIWYNGIPTIRAKTQYVLDQGFAGVMVWSLDQDATGDNSLLSVIHKLLVKK